MAVLRLPSVDTEAVRDAVRDLSRDVDLSRLSAIRDDLAQLDLPSASDLRRELAQLELPSASDLRRELDRFDVELPDVGRILRRQPPKPTPWLQMPSTALALGAVALVAGVVAGGVLAWLFQPDRGVERRKAVRRRLHRLQRSIQHRR